MAVQTSLLVVAIVTDSKLPENQNLLEAMKSSSAKNNLSNVCCHGDDNDDRNSCKTVIESSSKRASAQSMTWRVDLLQRLESTIPTMFELFIRHSSDAQKALIANDLHKLIRSSSEFFGSRLTSVIVLQMLCATSSTAFTTNYKDSNNANSNSCRLASFCSVRDTINTTNPTLWHSILLKLQAKCYDIVVKLSNSVSSLTQEKVRELVGNILCALQVIPSVSVHSKHGSVMVELLLKLLAPQIADYKAIAMEQRTYFCSTNKSFKRKAYQYFCCSSTLHIILKFVDVECSYYRLAWSICTDNGTKELVRMLVFSAARKFLGTSQTQDACNSCFFSSTVIIISDFCCVILQKLTVPTVSRLSGPAG